MAPPAKKVNWMAVNNESKWVEGEVNGFTCTIAPDTGAEVMIVPGKLVYELQLLQDWVYVKGLSGKLLLL